MLVLSRKKEQRLKFTVTEPTEFEIVIVSSKGPNVRLGIIAKPSVQVMRTDAVVRVPKPKRKI